MKILKTINLPLLIFILVALSQLVYLNSLSNQFVYDDEFTIVNNHFIKTWNNLPLLFSREYFKFSGELSYRPVVTITYFIDYALWRLNPFGFHLTSILFHAINIVLLFFLCVHFFHSRAASLVAVLLFLCHPVLSETVNAVSYREDLIGATFFLSAFLLYLKAAKGERLFSPPYVASLACYLSGVFSKEMALTLPFFLFFHDFFFTKKTNIGLRFSRYTGYIVVASFYLLIRFVIMHNPVESHVSYPGDSVFVTFLTMTKVLASYLKLFFFPFSLCADYVVSNSYSLLDTSFILSSLLLSALAVIASRMFFYSQIAFFCIVWFFITLLPVLNIVPIENIMAERYLYLPVMGLCMLASGKKIFFPGNAVTTVVVIVVLMLFSVTTIRRSSVWMDQIILWSDTAKRSPDSFKAHNNLGNIYRDSGRFDEAISEFKHALALYGGYIDAHNNLGVAYRKKGMHDEAMAEYQKALKLNPRYPYAHNNLGVLYAKSDLLDLAITEFQSAISHKPDYSDAHNNLGATYIRKGLYEKAIHECREAIKYNERYKDAFYNLSAAYFNDKQLEKALEAAEKVLSLDPNHHNAREIYNLICEEKGIEKNR